MSLLARWPNTNKTCASTAINKRLCHLPPKAYNVAHNESTIAKLEANPFQLGFVMSNWAHISIFAQSLALLLILASCTSVRPMTKIGLIAPFEGLYRESGYAALEAMRQAIAECTPAGMDVLPLALDDSGDPTQAARAAQKMLVDPTVRAIVGPLLLDAIPAVSSILSTTEQVAWYVPPLASLQRDLTPAALESWLAAQVDYITTQPDTNTEVARVLLLGLPTGWQATTTSGLPTTPLTIQVDTLDDALAILAEGDVILWLGRPDVGANWLTTLRAEKPGVQFWLADQAGMDILIAHTQDRKDFHWLIWRNSEYNPWLQLDENAQYPLAQPTEIPTNMTRYATYHATCVALQELGTQMPVTPSLWELHSQLMEQTPEQSISE